MTDLLIGFLYTNIILKINVSFYVSFCRDLHTMTDFIRSFYFSLLLSVSELHMFDATYDTIVIQQSVFTCDTLQHHTVTR